MGEKKGGTLSIMRTSNHPYHFVALYCLVFDQAIWYGAFCLFFYFLVFLVFWYLEVTLSLAWKTVELKLLKGG